MHAAIQAGGSPVVNGSCRLLPVKRFQQGAERFARQRFAACIRYRMVSRCGNEPEPEPEPVYAICAFAYRGIMAGFLSCFSGPAESSIGYSIDGFVGARKPSENQ